MRWIGFRTGLKAENKMEERETRRRRAERFVATARLILLWERIWPAMWPGMGIIGIGVIVALVGLFTILPGVVHALLLIVLFGSAAYFFWKTFSPFRSPRWEDGARRVERDSDLPNRPITEGTDNVAAGKGDPFAEGLWRAHIIRLLASAKNLTLKFPKPHMGARDPHGLRFAVLLGVIVGFIIAGPRAGERLVTGLMPVFGQSVDNSVFVAWVSPPTYTGLPPRSLTDTTVKTEEGAIQAPVNSTLVMRLRGTSYQPTIDARPIPKAGQPKFVKSDAGYEAKLDIAINSHVTVRLGSHSYGDWRFSIIPDKPPTGSFTETPQAQQNASLKIAYKASDDYGVVKAAALIRPLDDKGQEVKTAETLVVELPVPGSGRQISNTVYRDLTAHAFAGMKVHISLQAIDAAGQTGESAPLTIELPHRVFTEPLAQSLIEQRKNLAMGGEKSREKVNTAVDALSLGPEQFFKTDFGNYLAMRSLNHRLETPKDDPGAKSAQTFMWDMALALDEGDLADAAAELRRVQDQLNDALERGAPDEEIRALMDKLREAMARYMQQLARNAQRGNQQMAQMPPGARAMSQKDLQDLLKAIEDLARTGNRDQARQMLQALMQMLENMRMMAGRPGQGQQGQQGQQQNQQQNAMNDAIQGLSDLLGGQRQLLDRTFRAQQGQRGQQTRPARPTRPTGPTGPTGSARPTGPARSRTTGPAGRPAGSGRTARTESRSECSGASPAGVAG